MKKNRLLGFVAAAAFVGCGGSPEAERAKYHAELARYTPEILAKELMNRLGSLKVNAASAAEKAGADKGGEGGKKSEATKGNPFSAEAVVEDVAKKAKTIKDIPASDVYAQIVLAVDASSVDASVKETIRTKLKTAMGL